MIRILDANLNRLAIIRAVEEAKRFESINAENTLDFKAILDAKLSRDITDTCILELDDDYFDIAFFKKEINEDLTSTLEVEGEHVSYRLNNEQYNIEYFTSHGTPTEILDEILRGTPFTIGTVEFTTQKTYSAQQSMSRRQLLMEFTAYIGAELYFNKFEVSLVQHRGSTTIKNAIQGKNVKIVSKIVNKRKKDKQGHKLISYECQPLYLPEDSYTLGDNILLVQRELGIQEQLRVVSLGYDPYYRLTTELVFSNYVNGLADDLFYIETSAVNLNSSYYGARISPENGFESIRNDGLARAVFNADKFAMQATNSEGQMEDMLYFDPANGKYHFKGIIDATGLLTEIVITNYLYAEKGYISELTVDRLETSDKVQKYLNSDTSPVYYIRIYDQNFEWVGAETDGGATEQVKNRNNEPLFWQDEEHKAVVTEDTGWPVMSYVYTEYVKLKTFFEQDGNNFVPKMVWGYGIGDGDKGKGFIEKDELGLLLSYITEAGITYSLRIGENGIELGGAVTGGTSYLEYSGSIEWNANGMDVYFENNVKYSDKPTYVGVYPAATITPIMDGQNYAGVHLAPSGGGAGDLYNFTAICTGKVA